MTRLPSAAFWKIGSLQGKEVDVVRLKSPGHSRTAENRPGNILILLLPGCPRQSSARSSHVCLSPSSSFLCFCPTIMTGDDGVDVLGSYPQGGIDQGIVNIQRHMHFLILYCSTSRQAPRRMCPH